MAQWKIDKEVDYEVFNLGDLKLQKGMTLPDAKLAYKTFGRLNADKSNVIVLLTYMASTHYDNQWVIREGGALDPSKYFIVIPNVFGNGLSSSPSNTPAPYNKARFPHVTYYDNIKAQHRLLTEKFGITRIKMVTGWSMAAAQTFHWAALYPDMVETICPTAGSAKTAKHNHVMLEGVKAALTADDSFKDGWYDDQPFKGLRAMGRVYAGWGFSQEFFRKEEYLELGYASVEDFIVGYWEQWFNLRDANNMVAMIRTWQSGDISDNELYNGDFRKALGAIKAKAIVMPGDCDLYFPPEDSAFEVEHMPNAELRPFRSSHGHFAGGSGLRQADVKFLDEAWRELLGA
ncbi:alpha/beta fold hydrolase [Aminobacter carboxidus]|uniref:Alpha/beta fold hydrolase n=1 Tax=Aminobacter carboxidus TaxID=376165 RepID=A0ABR9GNC5_9HYPH|nr:alpha/beta fold hydrolase [Aminobacter carboxidus]MBE1205128.1 alpha/beta fold hydrolase [Aminobacter carboxidus]